MESANLGLKLNGGLIIFHIALLAINAVVSAFSFTGIYGYILSKNKLENVAKNTEFGAITLLQIGIGYICLTLGTDFNVKLS